MTTVKQRPIVERRFRGAHIILDRTRISPPNKANQEAALALLKPLVGSWNFELVVPTQPLTNLWGLWSIFDWMENGLFLTWRWGPSRPDFPGGTFPSALSIIGYDDTTQLFFVHYFDSLGVYRILDMTIQEKTWKMWMTAPGFSQRFTATFSEESNVITGAWEKSTDHIHWEHDFDMIFTRAR